jgi:hypothetical protein
MPQKCEDIITSLAERDPNTRQSAELVRRLTPTTEQHIRLLLTLEELGDHKPSQFLRHIRGLAPGVLEDLLHTISSSRLTPNIQALVACHPECNVDAAARSLDGIS